MVISFKTLEIISFRIRHYYFEIPSFFFKKYLRLTLQKNILKFPLTFLEKKLISQLLLKNPHLLS